MAITGQWKRRRIVINADAYISGATSNVPVLVKFNSTSHPDLFATGDDGDSVWFSSDAGGQTTLYHEGVVFSATDAIFYVKVDLSSTADTVIYFWYGTPSITGTESKADVWTNGVRIWHLEDLNDSLGNGNLTSNSTSATTGVIGGGRSFAGSTSSYLTLSSVTLSTNTVMVWIKPDTNAYHAILGHTTNKYGCYPLFENASTYYTLHFHTDSSSNWRIGTSSVSSDTGTWHLLTAICQGDTTAEGYYDNGTTLSWEGSTTHTSMSVNEVGREGTSYYPFSGILDELWIFSDNKSADFIKAIYNNTKNYSTFISIDGAVTIGSSPIQVYPVWPTSTSHTGTVAAGIGLAAAISTQSDFNRSVSSSIGIAAAITHTGTFGGIGISASVSITGDFSIPKYWGISILHGATTTDLYGENIIESASITDQLGKHSDEFEIRLYNNEGTYSESFAIGDDVYFYLGYTENPTTKIFHGVITSIEFDLPRVNENTMIIQGVDYGTFRLGQTMVVGIQEYINMTPTAIIQSLLNTYCPDITYTNVATFVDKIPNIRFAWEYVGDCVEMLATLVGADFYVDENDDLHFYDNSTMTSDHTISSDELISARIQKDSYKHYDRVYVIGGKEKYLDVNNATATTAIDTYAKYYASAFTVTKNNLLYVSAYIKKVGEMIEDLLFEIVEDDGAGDPLGDVVAWGKFPADNISTDAAWVQSTMIDAQLSTATTYWIVFKLVGRDSSNTYQIYHDNATANGHEDSDDGTSSWTDRTGLLAFKTYYGVQIIKSSNASQKIAGEYYTDILVADPNIEDFSTAEDLATQKVAEYALKHTSDLVVKSKFERFRSGDVVSLSITGLPTLEDQTILSTSMEFTEQTVSTVRIRTTPAIDFYNTFAGLFADLRKLKIKAMYLASNLSNDYLAGAETVTPADSATIIEAATDYTPQYDDTEAIWDVSKWQ